MMPLISDCLTLVMGPDNVTVTFGKGLLKASLIWAEMVSEDCELQDVPLLIRIETLLELLFATARSGLPSLLKSPTATEEGLEPAVGLVATLKLPVPVPRKIEMFAEL